MLAQYRCGVIVFMLSTSSSFFFHDTTTTEIYTLSLHDALPISRLDTTSGARGAAPRGATARGPLSARASYLPLSNLKEDRKSTRLNSSHVEISYAVFCLKKKKAQRQRRTVLRIRHHPSLLPSPA